MRLEFPRQVTICESCAREGFQSEKTFIPTDKKVRLIDAFTDMGFKKIEVGTFASPKAMPQFADLFEVLQRIKRKPGVSYIAIVPNERGVDRAIEAKEKGFGVDTIDPPMLSPGEQENRLLAGKSYAESLAELPPIFKKSINAGIKVISVIDGAFGSLVEGEDIPLKKVVELVAELKRLGSAQIKLADPGGIANPAQVYQTFTTLRKEFQGVEFVAHFHDARGAGLANCLAALQTGITSFDTSFGKTGGLPPEIFPMAGNICTEDLVNMFNEMGIDTGLDTDRVIECAKLVEEVFGRKLDGHVTRAGKVKH
jgi:hydroxymethylglutaryl-CoA lyase